MNKQNNRWEWNLNHVAHPIVASLKALKVAPNKFWVQKTKENFEWDKTNIKNLRV